MKIIQKYQESLPEITYDNYSLESIMSHTYGINSAIKDNQDLIKLKSLAKPDMDTSSIKILKIATESIARRYPMSSPITISVESYKDQYQVSMESLVSIVKRIWEVIMDTFKAIWAKLKFIFVGEDKDVKKEVKDAENAEKAVHKVGEHRLAELYHTLLAAGNTDVPYLDKESLQTNFSFLQTGANARVESSTLVKHLDTLAEFIAGFEKVPVSFSKDIAALSSIVTRATMATSDTSAPDRGAVLGDIAESIKVFTTDLAPKLAELPYTAPATKDKFLAAANITTKENRVFNLFTKNKNLIIHFPTKNVSVFPQFATVAYMAAEHVTKLEVLTVHDLVTIVKRRVAVLTAYSNLRSVIESGDKKAQNDIETLLKNCKGVAEHLATVEDPFATTINTDLTKIVKDLQALIPLMVTASSLIKETMSDYGDYIKEVMAVYEFPKDILDTI